MALLVLGNAVMQRYGEAKARRAALDFDDLVARTASLLRSSGAVEWVLYKLDGGLDHILVDEAQDTSPVQWNVIRALAEEFFSGAGASETTRTLFAVGDEKQSIYGFQGAEPEMFARTGEAFARSAQEARIAVAERAAHAVVPGRRATAGGGRPDIRDPAANPRRDRLGRADRARRAPHGTRRARRGVGAREARGGRGRRAMVAAGREGRDPRARAARNAHRRHHPRLARYRREAPIGGSPDPGRRHPDPRAQARPVRRGHDLGPQAARHQGGGRRPAGADRADRRAGPHRARGRLHAAGGRSGAGLRAQVAAARPRRRRPRRPGTQAQRLAVAGAVRTGSGQCALRRGRRYAEPLARSRNGIGAVRVLRRAARRRGHARADAGSARPRGRRRARRVPQPGAGLRRGCAALAAGLPRLAARGHPRHQARHGADAGRGARDDRARRQGPRGADRVPARHLLDAVGAAARQPAATRERRASVERAARRSCGRSRARAISPSCSRPRRQWR